MAHEAAAVQPFLNEKRHGKRKELTRRREWDWKRPVCQIFFQLPQIKALDTYETPPAIIWIDNSTIATLGNFSASTGKAKSKKTFNVSALVAASLAGKQVLNYRAHLPEGKRRILYVDTEQSRYHCHGAGTYSASGRASYHSRRKCDFICLREYSPTVRISVIDYALRQGKGYGLVIIDGIRDLMLDINSTSESVEVINKMMEWSSRYDLHYPLRAAPEQRGQQCTRPYRYGDEQQGGNQYWSSANATRIRLSVKSMPCISGKRGVQTFAFTVDDNGLPVIAEGHTFGDTPKPRQRTSFTELSIEQHPGSPFRCL